MINHNKKDGTTQHSSNVNESQNNFWVNEVSQKSFHLYEILENTH